jgi:hypothetical protein
LESYLKKFPALTTVALYLFRNISYPADEGAIEDVAAIGPSRNLKEFLGNRIMLTDTSAKYLMHKLPNLEALVLNRANHQMPHEKYTFILSSLAMMQLFDYVTKIAHYDVHFKIHQDENLINVIIRFIDVTHNNKKNTMLMIEHSNNQSTYPFTRIKNPSYDRDTIFSSITAETTTVIEALYDRIATVNE